MAKKKRKKQEKSSVRHTRAIQRDRLPLLQKRWQERQRPLPSVLAWAQERYTAVLAADGSTLDALTRKVGLLRDSETHPLGGKMMALLDLCSWLPRSIWYAENATTHDQHFWPQILKVVPAGALLLLDLGFTDFQVFAQMEVTFITRAKSNLSFKSKRSCCAPPKCRTSWSGLVQAQTVSWCAWSRYATVDTGIVT